MKKNQTERRALIPDPVVGIINEILQEQRENDSALTGSTIKIFEHVLKILRQNGQTPRSSATNKKKALVTLGSKLHQDLYAISSLLEFEHLIKRKVICGVGDSYSANTVTRFHDIVQQLAKGFLLETMREDNQHIDGFRAIVKSSKELHSYFIDLHLDWLTKIGMAIRKNSIKMLPHLDEKVCSFSRWLLSDNAKIYFQKKNELDRIIRLHSRIHGEAVNLMPVMQENDSMRVLLLYQRLHKLSSQLINSLTILSTRLAMNRISLDPLTGIRTRKDMEDILSNEIDYARNKQSSFAVVMTDIDNFKSINDRFGHQTGDCALIGFVTTLQKNLRKSDSFIRYGGEEFLIILHEADETYASEVAERLRKSLEKASFECGNHTIHITSSFGVALFHHNMATSIKRIIGRADTLLYQAKRKGKNCVVMETGRQN